MKRTALKKIIESLKTKSLFENIKLFFNPPLHKIVLNLVDRYLNNTKDEEINYFEFRRTLSKQNKENLDDYINQVDNPIRNDLRDYLIGWRKTSVIDSQESLSILPEEMWTAILLFLTEYDLMLLGQTCLYFMVLCHEPYIAKQVKAKQHRNYEVVEKISCLKIFDATGKEELNILKSHFLVGTMLNHQLLALAEGRRIHFLQIEEDPPLLKLNKSLDYDIESRDGKPDDPRLKITTLIRLPQGRLASGDYAGVIKIWDIASGECVYQFNHGFPITSLAVGKGKANHFLVSGGEKNSVAVWNLNTGKVVKRWHPKHNAEQIDKEMLGKDPVVRCIYFTNSNILVINQFPLAKDSHDRYHSYYYKLPNFQKFSSCMHSDYQLSDVCLLKDETLVEVTPRYLIFARPNEKTKLEPYKHKSPSYLDGYKKGKITELPFGKFAMSTEKGIDIIDLDSKTCIKQLTLKSYPRSIIALPDGNLFVITNYPSAIHFCQFATLEVSLDPKKISESLVSETSTPKAC